MVILLVAILPLSVSVRGQTQKKHPKETVINPKTIIIKALANYVEAQKVITKGFAYRQTEVQSTFDYKTGSHINELDTAYEVLDGEISMHRRAIPEGDAVGKGRFERIKKLFDFNKVLDSKFLDKLDIQIQQEGEIYVKGKPRHFYIFTFQVNEKLKGSDFTDDTIKKAVPILNKIVGEAEIWRDNLTFKRVSVKMVGEKVTYYAPPIAGGYVRKVEATFETQDLPNGLTVPSVASMEYKYNTTILIIGGSQVHVRRTYLYTDYKEMTSAKKMELMISVSGQPLYKPHEFTGLPRPKPGEKQDK